MDTPKYKYFIIHERRGDYVYEITIIEKENDLECKEAAQEKVLELIKADHKIIHIICGYELQETIKEFEVVTRLGFVLK